MYCPVHNPFPQGGYGGGGPAGYCPIHGGGGGNATYTIYLPYGGRA